MQPYGLERDYNVNDDYRRGGRAKRVTTQAKHKKMLHRRERRTWKHRVRKLLQEN